MKDAILTILILGIVPSAPNISGLHQNKQEFLLELSLSVSNTDTNPNLVVMMRDQCLHSFFY